MINEKTWKIRALSDIWTGAAKKDEESFKHTGLLGSLRWWYEVLVRGLGGYACDPSGKAGDTQRCPGNTDSAVKKGHHCVVCELFGCTDWARKFRFEVRSLTKEKGQSVNKGIQTEQIVNGGLFGLRFIELRHIEEYEWALLELTLRLIARYGAIGGRTVLKPSDEPTRMDKPHHQDYGLIEVMKSPGSITICRAEIENYIREDRWRKVLNSGKPKHGPFGWASVENMWFVKGRHLTRKKPDISPFNKILGRDERKYCRDCGSVHDDPREKCGKTERFPHRFSEDVTDHNKIWLAGSQGMSKKIFSFRNPERTFGFVLNPAADFTAIKKELQAPDVWGPVGWDFTTGDRIIDALFDDERGGA